MGPLSTYDRIQSLVRMPKYIGDLEKLKRLSGMKRIAAEEAFCRKYRLAMVVTEDFAKEYNRDHLGDTQIFMDIDPIVTIKPAGSFKPKPLIVKVKGRKEKVRAIDPRTYVLRDGRFLTLEIDLTRKAEDIEKRAKQWVRLYKHLVDDDSSHRKENAYDPWEIYDLHKIEGLKLVEIARRKSGLDGSPNYNDSLRAYDRKVRRAYQKACQMIKSVSHR